MNLTRQSGLLLIADTDGFIYLRDGLLLSGNSDDCQVIEVAQLLGEQITLVKISPRQPNENTRKISLNEAVGLIERGVIADIAATAAILKAERLKLITNEIKILFQDEFCVAADKPSGLLVHRTSMSRDNDFLLQRVRDLTGNKVYPIHRLDRQTSGVTLLAFSKEYAAEFFKVFREREVSKIYLAVVRGHTDPAGIIDYPLRNDNGKAFEAVTEYSTLAHTELPIPVGPYQSARYSLIRVSLKTGRTHQIRRHFAHLRHPLVGDATYGDGRHNRMFREKFDSHRLLLHAAELSMKHPLTGQNITIAAPLPPAFQNLLDKIELKPE